MINSKKFTNLHPKCVSIQLNLYVKQSLVRCDGDLCDARQIVVKSLTFKKNEFQMCLLNNLQTMSNQF